MPKYEDEEFEYIRAELRLHTWMFELNFTEGLSKKIAIFGLEGTSKCKSMLEDIHTMPRFGYL